VTIVSVQTPRQGKEAHQPAEARAKIANPAPIGRTITPSRQRIDRQDPVGPWRRKPITGCAGPSCRYTNKERSLQFQQFRSDQR